MNDQEAYEYYADPAHLEIAGPARKHPKDRLTEVLTLRVSPSLLNQVASSAASEGRSVSAWVRQVLRVSERLRREAARGSTAKVTGGRAVSAGVFPARPEGLIPGSGWRGDPEALPSSLPRTFTCPHLSVGNAMSVSCSTCGQLEAA